MPALLGAETAWGTARTQLLLGALTWLLLLGLLRRERSLVRAQVAVVVGYATLVEYGFSAGLHVYTYRLGGVPSFVPPGHGLVYLAALCLGRSRTVQRRAVPLVAAAAVALTAWACWGVSGLSARPDLLGALWALCWLVFLARGRSPLVYAGAAVVVTWLELWGTGLGTWTWSPHSPTGLISQGNPPSGAAGGYCFFDQAAMALAPWLVAATARLRRVRR